MKYYELDKEDQKLLDEVEGENGFLLKTRQKQEDKPELQKKACRTKPLSPLFSINLQTNKDTN